VGKKKMSKNGAKIKKEKMSALKNQKSRYFI